MSLLWAMTVSKGVIFTEGREIMRWWEEQGCRLDVRITQRTPCGKKWGLWSHFLCYLPSISCPLQLFLGPVIALKHPVPDSPILFIHSSLLFNSCPQGIELGTGTDCKGRLSLSFKGASWPSRERSQLHNHHNTKCTKVRARGNKNRQSTKEASQEEEDQDGCQAKLYLGGDFKGEIYLEEDRISSKRTCDTGDSLMQRYRITDAKM